MIKRMIATAAVALSLAGAMSLSTTGAQAAPASHPTLTSVHDIAGKQAAKSVNCGTLICLWNDARCAPTYPACPFGNPNYFGRGDDPLHVCNAINADYDISAIINNTSSGFNLYRTASCGGSTVLIHHGGLMSTDAVNPANQFPSGWAYAVLAIARNTVGS